MATEVLTTDDLREFKIDLLKDIRNILNISSSIQRKRWLKSSDVRELLSISAGTLQNMRVNGTIPFSKMGGVILYDSDELEAVIKSNRIAHHNDDQ